MGSLLIYFLPTILALGAVTSYEDLKEGKIRNKYLVGGAVLGIMTQIFLILFDISGWSILLTNIVYSTLALLIGFLLWHFGWWSSGDAKLLATFTLLVPPSTYFISTTPLPFLEIIFNTLIPIFFYLLAYIIIKTNTKNKITALKKTVEPKRMASAILAIFSMSWLNIYIFNLTGLKPNIITNMLIIIIVMTALEKVLKENTLPFLVLVSILRIFLNTEYFITRQFLISFIFMIAIYLLLIGFIRNLAENYTKKINIYGLEPGMVLAEGVLRTGVTAPFREYKQDRYIINKTTPLAEKEIIKIRKMHQKGLFHFNKIQVNQTIPFAPHIFLGTIITIICQGNAVLFLSSLII
jgi:Flp pilus assembly protein protease CpaA